MEGTQTVSDGNSAPATFEAAFAADASSAPEASAQSSTPAAAEAPPTETAESTPAVQDTRSPFIPRERFDEVNTERNALKQWKEQYAWAEQADRQAISQAVDLAQRYQRDPIGFLNELAAEVQNDPTLGPQLRSMAARTLGAAKGQQAAQPPQLVPVQLEDGSVVQMPRDPQAWLQWHQQQWMQQVEQKMAPALTAAEQLQLQEMKRQAESWTGTFYQELTESYGDLTPHHAAIAAEVQRQVANLPRNDPRRDAPEFLEAATLRAVNKVVLPALAKARQQDLQQAKSAQLDELQRKAAASTAPNPGSAVPTTQRQITSFTDASLQWS